MAPICRPKIISNNCLLVAVVITNLLRLKRIWHRGIKREAPVTITAILLLLLNSIETPPPLNSHKNLEPFLEIQLFSASHLSIQKKWNNLRTISSPRPISIIVTRRLTPPFSKDWEVYERHPKIMKILITFSVLWGTIFHHLIKMTISTIRTVV